MRRQLLRLVLAGIAGCLIAARMPGVPSPAVASPELQPTFEQRLQAIDDMASRIKGLQASFLQRKFTPMLKKPMESSGSLAVRGSLSRWDTERPHRSIMTIDDSTLRIFYPEHRLQEVFTLGQDVRIFSGSPLPRIERVRELFDVVEAPGEIEDDDPAKASRLAMRLTPKDEDLRKHVLCITVVIDTSIPCATRITMEMPDGDRTQIEFSDVRVVDALDDADVTFDPPAGTRIEHPLGEPAPADPEPER